MTLDEFLLKHDGLTDLLVVLGFIGAWAVAMLTGIFVKGLL